MNDIERRPNRLPWPPMLYVSAIALAVLANLAYTLPWLTPPLSEILFAVGWLLVAAVVAIDVSAMRTLMLACCDYLGLVGWRPDRPVREVAMPVQLLRIGDLAVLALPGEVLVAVGRDWSRRTGLPGAHVMALANGHFRYLPHPDHECLCEHRRNNSRPPRPRQIVHSLAGCWQSADVSA